MSRFRVPGVGVVVSFEWSYRTVTNDAVGFAKLKFENGTGVVDRRSIKMYGTQRFVFLMLVTLAYSASVVQVPFAESGQDQDVLAASEDLLKKRPLHGKFLHITGLLASMRTTKCYLLT